ncbi:hypothetical protein OIU74_001033 [Salix koriyanagi]|uniref:Uncharacterized protein n=1 Tax=Salix koriyanagi TaxID=2511006 RepID=A0A9Q0X1D1_9ROSI|nr:hypothetical protein OIU74_001033 [Salix koriyanagi]
MSVHICFIDVVSITIILLCHTPTSCKFKILAIRTKNHRCAVSVEGNPGQEQVLTFLSNGIPFVTLDLFFPQIESFLCRSISVCHCS